MTLRGLLAVAWLGAVSAIARAYPAPAVSDEEEGTVLVKAEVDVGGRVVDPKIYKSSGYRDLDAAALRSIMRGSFSPATQDGKPIAQVIVIPVRFQLTGKATGTSGLLQASSTVASIVLLFAGMAISAVGFVWPLVLGKRQSVLWFWGMVPVWLLGYPVSVAMHWPPAKHRRRVRQAAR